MNKQDLIDKLVDELNGVWPAHWVTAVYDVKSGRVSSWPPRRNAETLEHLCTPEEFEQRARELGWINGYKWGVEYPTNGKKPDLPGDIVVEFLHSGNCRMIELLPLKSWSWDVSTAFRIVDERYKPVEQPLGNSEQLNNSWHDRGELPPVGWKGEYKPFWHACEVVAYHDGFAVVWDAHDLEYFRTSKPEIFRPIKSEREKFHDSALELYDDNAQVWLDSMFNAGFRAPE